MSMPAKKPPFISHNIDPDDLEWDIDTDPRFYLADTQEIACYWTNGKQVFYRYRPIKQASPETFVYYNSLFAKDDKRCYIMYHELKGAQPDNFHVLNGCYATDSSLPTAKPLKYVTTALPSSTSITTGIGIGSLPTASSKESCSHPFPQAMPKTANRYITTSTAG